MEFNVDGANELSSAGRREGEEGRNVGETVG